MRLIDADALMNYADNMKDKTIDANDIARFPAAVGWISVQDSLPKEGQIVIVSDGKHAWDVGQYKGLCIMPGCDLRHDSWYWKKNTIKTVLWWMLKESALPKPPKGDNND